MFLSFFKNHAVLIGMQFSQKQRIRSLYFYLALYYLPQIYTFSRSSPSLQQFVPNIYKLL